MFVCARLGILQRTFNVFCFIIILSEFLIKVRGGVRARGGAGDGFRVRDRDSVRARGGLGFI